MGKSQGATMTPVVAGGRRRKINLAVPPQCNACLLPPLGAHFAQCPTCRQVALPLAPVATSPPGGDPRTRVPCLCRPLPLVCFDEGRLKVGTLATQRKATEADQWVPSD